MSASIGLLPSLLVALSVGAAGQSVTAQKPLPTFHVSGTITSPWDSLLNGVLVPKSKVAFQGQQYLPVVTRDSNDSYIRVPRTEITFEGEHASKTVVVDEHGAYDVELTIGFYRMSAHGPTIGTQPLTEYVRLFRVDSSATIVVNGSLYMARNNCDAVGPADDPEYWKSICGGEDYLPPPSKDGTPLQVYIRFPQRSVTNDRTVYSADTFAWPGVPVFVAYNLFSLDANTVIYHPKDRILEARGAVVIRDASGERHTDSATFRMENGRAVPVN